MTNVMAPQLVTLPTWADEVGVSYETVKQWKKRSDFPRPYDELTPKFHRYRRVDLGAFLRRNPNLGKRRGEWNRKP